MVRPGWQLAQAPGGRLPGLAARSWPKPGSGDAPASSGGPSDAGGLIIGIVTNPAPRRPSGNLMLVDAIEALELPESRWAVVGGPVHYCEWPGPLDGPIFVLVHGLGGSLLNWAPVAAGLAERGRVLALDLVGFGLTPLEGRSARVGSNWKVRNGFM